MMTKPNDALFELLEPDRITAVVDIGANPIDGEPPYKGMHENGLCSIVGFEPQKDALASLNKKKGPLETYLPYAVGDGGQHTLHICHAPGMTSLLQPDMQMLSLLNLFSDFGKVVAKEPVETRKLDDINEVVDLDYLKIDIQGSELSVFKAGRKKLEQAVAIQTEVSFIPLYVDQPSFGDVDQELRSQGFIPHTFAAIKRWPISPLVFNNDPRQGLNQVLEADIVYVRDFSQQDSMDDEQLKHLSLITHHIYGSFDLTAKCLLMLEQRGCMKEGAQQQYTQILSKLLSPKP